MSSLLSIGFWAGLLAAGIRVATGIGLAGLGELLTERSGVLNLGIEGTLVMGTLTGVFVTTTTQNPWLGLLGGAAVGSVFGIFHAWMSVSLKVTPQELVGLGVFFFGVGLSAVLYGVWDPGTMDATIRGIYIPFLSEIPFFGRVLFRQDVIVYLLWGMVGFFWLIFNRSKVGLRIRVVGERPDLADTSGINVSKYRYLCTVLGAALMGFAGAYLGIARYQTFMIGITRGIGWIGLGIVYFGKWEPGRTYLGAILFGTFWALQARLQTAFPEAPYQLFVMLPYILVIVMLVLIAREATGPSALAKPYEREEA